MRDLRARFEDKFMPEPLSGCWLWIGSRYPQGYGQFSMGHAHGERAHRVAWLIYRGEIPPDTLVCHRCDTPSCVNPAHLFLGTHADNMRDMSVKGRSGSARKTMCPKGHPYTDSNILWERGRRRCRECRRIRSRARDAIRADRGHGYVRRYPPKGVT